ncbi:uncharacterized protein LOC126836816 [Adelges cooleyi]|uniref:uncharacterized protein LOC126836816 n=1 Tax=Adelges cooleyi TaxID=133065 RepID=UPI00217FC879|nr:uncharacterized protein LOC126836816 [Adelges cooleyi]
MKLVWGKDDVATSCTEQPTTTDSDNVQNAIVENKEDALNVNENKVVLKYKKMYKESITLRRLSDNEDAVTTGNTDKRVKKKKSESQRKKRCLRRRQLKKMKKLSEHEKKKQNLKTRKQKKRRKLERRSEMNTANNSSDSAPDGTNDHVENILETGNHTQAPNGRDSDSESESNNLQQQVPSSTVDDHREDVDTTRAGWLASSASISDFSEDESGRSSEDRSYSSADEGLPPPPHVKYRDIMEVPAEMDEYNGVSSTVPMVAVQPPSSPPPPPNPPPRTMKLKKKLLVKVTALKRVLKTTVRQYAHVYAPNPITEQLALLLKAGDMLHHIYQYWDTRQVADIRDFVRWLIYSLNDSPRNIVPLIGCLMTLFRRTCPTAGMTAMETYGQFKIFINAIKECVREVNVQFYRTWMTPESFLFACFFIDHELFRDTHPDYTFMSHRINWSRVTAFKWYLKIPPFRVPQPTRRSDDTAYQPSRMIVNRGIQVSLLNLANLVHQPSDEAQ